ncbi:LTA synthase family protein [Pseudoclostridium thermosuccinogenes]|uniref:LTA synthase family protein n=1 Tax=Clostridium thermosuccinogenes TaxID=84032 RepID=UPI002FDA6781
MLNYRMSEMLKRQIHDRVNRIGPFLNKYRLLIFFIGLVNYYELVYRLWIFKNMSLDFIFPVLFSFSCGVVLFLACGIFKERINKILAFIFIKLLFLVYSVQLIYFCIFRTPLSLYSITGAGDALRLKDIVISAILKNIAAVILLLVPMMLFIIFHRRFSFFRVKPETAAGVLVFCLISFTVSIACVNMTNKNTLSQYTLYYKTFSPELSVSRLGLLTTMRLDIQRLIFGSGSDHKAAEVFSRPDGQNTGRIQDNRAGNEEEGKDGKSVGSSDSSGGIGMNESNSEDNSKSDRMDIGSETGMPKAETSPYDIYNIMDIDFKALTEGEKNPAILDMHRYFSTLQPTKKNEYTGMFKGDNLIMITAESFAPYALSPELTPTLYEMSKSGFVFNNFYNPVWGVSTTDGEYVACTGLIPKTGTWSMAKSGKNHMPFTMGNQFKKLGYTTKAYHNHTYTYYKRHISHPNMGYEFKAVGNGLNIKETWPESDLEMIEVTTGEFIGLQPFHAYYMTISGHMNYNFYGNNIAMKNKQYVEHLPYSDESKAYIACNLELEFAVRTLIERLEEAGIADKTVIAISADHYPYGLPRECIDELAGHKVENNFELYKSTFILWKKGMDPVVVDKPCSSLDIIPTLSNLFGLEYDSRLLMGSDILSDAPPLVIFSNRSWITERAMYNSITDTAVFTDGSGNDSAYIELINSIVADKFLYSEKILDTDYYDRVLPKGN